MKNKEKNELILRLNAKKTSEKIYHSMLPEKYEDDLDIILAERQLGMRTIDSIGFDVIWNKFFVYESVLDIDDRTNLEVWRGSAQGFDSFEEFYDYLDGNIYENACYYQYDFSNVKRDIDLSRIPKQESFIHYNIDNFTLSPSEEEMSIFKNGYKTHKNCVKWIEKCLSCSSGGELAKFLKKYEKSSLYSTLSDAPWPDYRIYRNIMLWVFVDAATKDDTKFDALMQFVSDDTCAGGIVRELCTFFNPDKVVEKYNYGYNYRSGYKQKKRLKDFALSLKRDQLECTTKAFFDVRIHFYCEQKTYRFKDRQIGVDQGTFEFVTYRYFESFDDFVDYRHGDLSNTDLSGNIDLDHDFSAYRRNKATILPIHAYDNLTLKTQKLYSEKGSFDVLQTWCDSNGTIIKHYKHSFNHFFDFVAFLKGDLSNANLAFCDGIKNIPDASKLNFTDAELTSEAYEKLGIEYTKVHFDNEVFRSFDLVCENEKSTELILNSTRSSEETDELDEFFADYDKERIHYVSDLHLMHKLLNKNARNKNDIIRILKSTANTIVSGFEDTVIIVGDVSSDFKIFEDFIHILRKELDKRSWKKPNVIFVLGNHDLWSFPDLSFESIVEKYRSLLTQNGMYLLQNEILYKDHNSNINYISEEELLDYSPKKIRKTLSKARLILFGGLAFSGFNQEFNANNGIYRATINRLEEQGESLKFCDLYEKVTATIPDRNVVVATHMPMDCWRRNVEYQNGYVYVSGHTHKNYFYDDGDIRVYSDNQIGYGNNSPYLKWFDVDSEYDCFSDYSDGIYKISGEDYQDFHRGKNIMISFNRPVFVLYMLKKNGYYCFIHESRNGSLCILNGGAMKKLEIKNINYYYANMDRVISLIKSPLDAYTKVQEQIADEVRKIGGEGRIHGCIIDLDFFNHIYLNPLDMKITGYSATDIINKKIYPSIPSLLKNECPSLYGNYRRYIQEAGKNSLVMVNKTAVSDSKIPQMYLETDIYRASREIKKMQKLNSNILSTWHEPKGKGRRIES